MPFKDNASEGYFGIKSDPRHFPENDHGDASIMRTVSPEFVLPTSLPVSQTVSVNCSTDTSPMLPQFVPTFDFDVKPDLLKTPDKSFLQRKNKRKQCTPHRSPFNDLTNFDSLNFGRYDSDEDLHDHGHISNKRSYKRQKVKDTGGKLSRSSV